MRNRIESAIKRVSLSDDFWDVLLDGSTATSGPFDGGCLICAKGIILAFGGELVRITSPLNGGQTEHYGALIDHVIYDFDGPSDSSEGWIERLKNNEQVFDRELRFVFGYDEETATPDDPVAAKRVSMLLLNCVEMTRKRLRETKDGGRQQCLVI